MKHLAIKVTLKKVFKTGEPSYIKTGTKRRFLKFISLGNWKKLAIYTTYPDGAKNQGEYTNKVEARKALEAFLE